MALGLFSSVPVMAQYYDRNGLFDKGGDGHASNANTSVGLMNKGAASVNGNLSNQGFGANESGITNQTFESPIGSGLFVLATLQ